jgi:hypothetical protein
MACVRFVSGTQPFQCTDFDHQVHGFGRSLSHPSLDAGLLDTSFDEQAAFVGIDDDDDVDEEGEGRFAQNA